MKARTLLPAVIFCLVLFYSCDKEDSRYLYGEPTIYSESNKTLFSEITL